MAAMDAPAKIAISGLRKAFGPKKVLDGVDLSVAKGDSLVVIGGSGTGKSVLLKTILGLIQPDAGSIRIDGEETVGIDTAARERTNARFGMLFQGAALSDVINDLIVSCTRELGATTVSITHDMQSARKIATHVAMLHGGRIIWTGPISEIDRSGSAHVEQFIHGRAEGPIQMQVKA